MDERTQIANRARRLAKALIEPADDAACSACLDALEAYVDLQIDGANYQAAQPTVARHLDSCVACADAYAMLYEARLAEARMPVPSIIPTFDLSFLRQPAPAPMARRLAELGDAAARLREAMAGAVDRTGERLRLTLSTALLELMPPPLATAAALRSAAAEGAPLVELTLDEPDGPVEHLRLSVYARLGAPDHSTVRVRVALRGLEWPDLAEVPVTLNVDGKQHEAVTDVWGEAVFEAIATAAVPRLQVEIDTAAIPPTTT